MKTQTVTIIGLDRTGGSIGMALHASDLGLNVVGHDKDRAARSQAEEMGAIDRGSWNLVNAASEADILVLTVHFSELRDTLRAIGGALREHTLVIDLSALKGPGLRWAEEYFEQGHYIGARPVLAASMLEDDRTGIEAARADLFQESVFCIMASPKADPKAVETAVNFGRILGATPFFLDVNEYDSLVQGVETAPGLLAAALFQAVSRTSGWRDILRFAGSSFAQATMAMDNLDLAALIANDRDASLRWVDAILTELREVRRVVAEADVERMALIFEDLAIKRDTWLEERRKNDWTEESRADYGDFSMRTIMLGGYLGRGEKGDKS
jgi:prephenate dehydrogenase